MGMIACHECGQEISSKAKSCPHCGAKPKSHTGKLFLLLIVIIVGGLAMMGEDKSPAQEAAARAEDKRKGFHCLSSFDGSHRGVKDYVVERMRDPDSFEHVETRITPVKDGSHTLTMAYRAKNGFGGINVATAVATIQNADCSATILSME